MLTLNQTPGNNSDSIWVMRLRGEGNNILTNGDFGSSSGWTLNGGWVISGGVATYTEPGTPPLDNSLYRAIPAVENTSYVLEYEVTSCSDSTIEMNIEGGGDNIVSIAVRLDNTLGKHTISLLGVATKTKFTISFSSIGAGDSIAIDNLKLRKLDNIVYLSTRDINLTNNYSGQLLNKNNYISEIPFNSTILEGGGTGSVTSFNFSISRYVSDTNLDGFINEFYPSTDGGFIVGRVIDFGLCWIGATADTDITWLFRGRVIDYTYLQRQLNFVVFQESELTNKEIPYYTIQKTFNNGVSYYLNAPTENYGINIPIVYGSFNLTSLPFDIKQFSPSPCIDKRYLMFIQASHKLYSQNHPGYTNSLFRYIDGLDTYMIMIPDNGTSTNNNYLSKVQLYAQTRAANESIYGTLYLVPKGIGQTSDINDIEDILNDTDTTYVVVNDADELGLKLASGSSGDIGALGQLPGDFVFSVEWQSTNGDQRQISLKGYNEALSSPAYVGSISENTTLSGAGWELTELQLGNYTSNKSNANLPWTIEEVCNMSYVALNNSGAGGAVSGDINIRSAYVRLINIIIVGRITASKYQSLNNGNMI